MLRRYSWSQKKGFYVASFMVWYGTSRFLTDFFRAQDLPLSDQRWFGLTAAQYVCLLLLIGGLYLFQRIFFNNFKKINNEKES